MASILVLNGPNLNLLGSREPDKYGHRSLQEIMEELDRFAGACGHQLQHVQENSEGVLIDAIHKAACNGIDYIIFNPAAYTHTSVALRDALLGVARPFVEVHLSDPSTREAFRSVNFLHDIAIASVVGQGPRGYVLGLDAIVEHLRRAGG